MAAVAPVVTPPEVIDLTRPAPLPDGLMVDIALGLARVPEVWRPHTRSASGRHAVRLLATETYEAWVICWGGDGPVTLHDHGDAAGTVVVVEGELVEARPGGRRRLGPGSVAQVPVGVAHDVVPTDGPATSIHVYSPPLATVAHYDETGARTAVEPVAAVPAVHDAPSYVRALDAACPHG